MCAVSPVVHTSNISSCQKKKNFFSFPVAVKNSIKVGPLVFLSQMFVIMENITKRPVYIVCKWLKMLWTSWHNFQIRPTQNYHQPTTFERAATLLYVCISRLIKTHTLSKFAQYCQHRWRYVITDRMNIPSSKTQYSTFYWMEYHSQLTVMNATVFWCSATVRWVTECQTELNTAMQQNEQ